MALAAALPAKAQNLFVSTWPTSITEFTPSGTQSIFAFGLSNPSGLAFNRVGDLFEADYISGHIYEFTPGGAKSTFASALSGPSGLAFNSAGDLFVADQVSGHIYEYTPGGVQSTFAFGLSTPIGLAFNSAGDLFESDLGSGHIYEFTPDGTQSTFASGLNSSPFGLAFEPVPEPSAWALAGLGLAVLPGLRRRNAWNRRTRNT